MYPVIAAGKQTGGVLLQLSEFFLYGDVGAAALILIAYKRQPILKTVMVSSPFHLSL